MKKIMYKHHIEFLKRINKEFTTEDAQKILGKSSMALGGFLGALVKNKYIEPIYRITRSNVVYKKLV